MIRLWGMKSFRSGSSGNTLNTTTSEYMATLARGLFIERYPGLLPSVQHCTRIYNEYRDGELLQSLRPLQPTGKTLLTNSNGQIGLGSTAANRGDIICCLPGCEAPLLLRPASSGTFEVVGDCYFYHLEDEQGVLGPMPPTWTVQIEYDTDGFPFKQYHNTSTGKFDCQDPRLNKLPSEYEPLPVVSGKPRTVRNVRTGEIVKKDTRLTSDDLMARGIELETFRLV